MRISMRGAARIMAALVCTAALPGTLYAQRQERQTQAVSDYQPDAEGKIGQRISWTRVNAYFYEVEIERRAEAEQWVPELKERTEETALALSLGPGMYRYRVHTYNVLGKIAASTAWTSLRVFAAKAPAAELFSPASFYIDSRQDEFVLDVSGADLVEDALLFLRAKRGLFGKTSGDDSKNEAAKDTARVIRPARVSYGEDEGRIQAVFAAPDIALGNYHIVIVNPGGIEQILDGFTVTLSRHSGFSLSLGYAPIAPMTGYLFAQYNRPAYPLGIYARLGFTPVNQHWGSLGLELTPSWTSLTTTGLATAHGAYTLEGHLVVVDLNTVYQKWFNHWTMSVKFRLGGGISGFTGMRFIYHDGTGAKSPVEHTLLFNVNGGLSFDWTLWRGLFVETGLDYMYCFSSRNTAPGFFRAAAGLGWRF